MMMTTIVFNKQQHIRFLSRQMIAAVRVQVSQTELNNRSLACGRCWLLSDWYCIGCPNNKKYPPIPILPNTCEYCPVPNSPNTVSL